MKYIIMSVIGMIICITTIVIIKIRDNKVMLNEQDEEIDRDFIDTFVNYKKRKLSSKPWVMDYKTYKVTSTVSAIIVAVVTFITTANILYTVLFSLIGALFPELIIAFQSASQKTEFEERYATGLRQLVACLKSGLTIQQSISDVCVSPFVHDTIRSEFQRINADIQLGISIKDAFERFSNRVDSQDAKDVSIAINMQSKIGGREAETIESIAKNISSRVMLRKEVASLFAGSKMTVLVMDFMPFIIITILYFASPVFLAPYFESAAMTFVFVFILALIIAGSVITHKSISKLRKDSGI